MRFHVSFWPGIRHLSRMCSIFSVCVQCVHMALSSKFSMLFQYSPIFCAPLIVLYRNSLCVRYMFLFLFRSVHRDSVVGAMSHSSVMSSCILSVLDFVLDDSGGLSSSISALYISAWVMWDSFAPVMRPGWLGLAPIGSGSVRPVVASLSAASLPWLLAWPLVHFITVFPFLALRRSIASKNHCLLLTPIHPQFSQCSRFSVRPFIVYCESVIIWILSFGSVSSVALMTA